MKRVRGVGGGFFKARVGTRHEAGRRPDHTQAAKNASPRAR